MVNEKRYFGYEEKVILEVFRNSKDQTDKNKKIMDTSTLSQLVESSGKMLKENRDFLYKMLEPY